MGSVVRRSLELLLIIALAEASDPQGCEKADHAACDELCKVDGFWYGHCARWDGRDFACNCLPYVTPLDPAVCDVDRHVACDADCHEKTRGGGFCYPHPNVDIPKGVPKCQCFADLNHDLQKANSTQPKT